MNTETKEVEVEGEVEEAKPEIYMPAETGQSPKTDVANWDESTAGNTESEKVVSAILQMSMDPKADIQKMQAIMDMKNDMDDRSAEKQFSIAMALAQGEMEPVARTAWNDQTKSYYSRFDQIIRDIKPIYTKHGFALIFSTGRVEDDKKREAGWYRVNCTVTHAAGHSKEFFMDLPPDEAGIAGTVNKTPMHAFGSTNSYGKKYLTTGIFNIAMLNEDNDGNGAPPAQQVEMVSEADIVDLRKVLHDADSDEEYIFKTADIKSLAEIPLDRLPVIISHLKRMPTYQENRPHDNS